MTARVRFVDINEFYSPTGGGVRTYLDRKMAILGEMGHELIVVAPGRADRVLHQNGGRVIYLKSPGMPFDRNYGLFWDAAPIHRLLDELDPDVVEASSPWRPAWIVGDWHGRALKSFFVHNDNIESYAKRWFENIASPERIERSFDWYNRYMRRFLARFDTVVANGPTIVRRYRARGLRVDAAVGLGIERQHFSPAFRDEGVRRSLLARCGLPADAHLLVGFGRHHPEKRWPMVIDAVERAGARIPVGLVIFGQGMDSRALDRRLADSPHVRLFRPVYDRAQMARIMASADAFIHGNETETFGLVASEALASGTPLIVPDTGGCSDIADQAFAETYGERDARQCAAAILRLFARDQIALRDAARAAAARVRTDREHAAALVDYYRSLVATRAAA